MSNLKWLENNLDSLQHWPHMLTLWCLFLSSSDTCRRWGTLTPSWMWSPSGSKLCSDWQETAERDPVIRDRNPWWTELKRPHWRTAVTPWWGQYIWQYVSYVSVSVRDMSGEVILCNVMNEPQDMSCSREALSSLSVFYTRVDFCSQ